MQKHRKIKPSLFSVLFCLIMTSSAQAVEYNTRYLSPLSGDVSSYFYGMNRFGLALGASESADGRTTSVIWSAGGSVSALISMHGRSINNHGQIAGQCQQTGQLVIRDADGSTRTLGAGYGGSINDSGQVAGAVNMPTPGGELMVRAAIWESDGTMKVIDDRTDEANSYILSINDSGAVIGKWYYRTDHVEYGFMWSEQTGFIDLGTFDESIFLPNAISDDGRITGLTSVGCFPVLRDTDGSFTQLSDISYSSGSITADGHIIINEGRRSYIMYSDGSQQLLPAIDSWHSFGAHAITDSGMIGGQCHNPSENRWMAVVWEPVPEPTSLLGLTCGLTLLGGAILRKRKIA